MRKIKKHQCPKSQITKTTVKTLKYTFCLFFKLVDLLTNEDAYFIILVSRKIMIKKYHKTHQKTSSKGLIFTKLKITISNLPTLKMN